jgi:hypothetical protein
METFIYGTELMSCTLRCCCLTRRFALELTQFPAALLGQKTTTISALVETSRPKFSNKLFILKESDAI